MDEAIFQLISPRELLKYLSIEIMFLMQNLTVRDLKHKTTIKNGNVVNQNYYMQISGYYVWSNVIRQNANLNPKNRKGYSPVLKQLFGGNFVVLIHCPCIFLGFDPLAWVFFYLFELYLQKIDIILAIVFK